MEKQIVCLYFQCNAKKKKESCICDKKFTDVSPITGAGEHEHGGKTHSLWLELDVGPPLSPWMMVVCWGLSPRVWLQAPCSAQFHPLLETGKAPTRCCPHSPQPPLSGPQLHPWSRGEAHKGIQASSVLDPNLASAVLSRD